MLCVYTSFLFGLIARRAYLDGRVGMGNAWLAQYGLSILHHAHGTDGSRYPGGNLVVWADRALANANWMHAFWLNLQLPFGPDTCMVWVCLAYVVTSYYGYLKQIGYEHYEEGWEIGSLVHASMHVVSFLGVMAILRGGRVHTMAD